MNVDLSKEFLNTVLQLSHNFQTSVKLNTLHTLDCALHFLEHNFWPCEHIDDQQSEICSERIQILPSCSFKNELN